MVPPTSHKVPRVSWYSGSCRAGTSFAYGALALSGRLSQNRSAGLPRSLMQSVTPWRTRHGLGSSTFARRYSGNRCFFLFLRVLRCFSSPGSLVCTMDSCKRDWSSASRVSPFGYQGIYACLRLPLAFRSLPRPSSALGALASTLCSCSLDFFVVLRLRYYFSGLL